MAGWSTPRTWVVDEVVTASMLNSHLRDLLLILGAGARVYHNAAQDIPHATWTSLAFNSERYDPDGFHSNVTNNSRFMVPAGFAGRYDLWAGWQWAGNSNGSRHARFSVNGTAIIAQQFYAFSGGGSPSVSEGTLSGNFPLYAAGDFVEIQVYQSSGVPLAINSAPFFSAEFSIQGRGGLPY